MHHIEWFKCEARGMRGIDAKIMFASDIFIHAKNETMLRFARKYYEFLCEADRRCEQGRKKKIRSNSKRSTEKVVSN